MTEDKKTAVFTADQAERAVWEQPELRRMEAGNAEAASGGTTDLGVLS